MSDIRKEQLRRGKPANSEGAYIPDLTKMLGCNPSDLVGPKDPFGGEIPNDEKGYSQFQKYHEENMLDLLKHQGVLRMTAMCQGLNEKGELFQYKKPRPDHFGSDVTLACEHIILQDWNNPEGVYFLPLKRGFSDGYYICKTCWKLMQARKFNIGLEIKGKCSSCICEALEKIERLHPDRLINLASLS